jgi:drug/metabolite transporter (DMT)-like permease
VYARSAPLPDSPALVTSLEMIAGGVLLTALGAGTGEFGRLNVASVSASSLLGLGWLIVAGSIIGFTAYVYANATLPNDTVATYAYVNPVIAVTIGAALGREEITLPLLLGGAIILSSVVLIVTGRRREGRAGPEPVTIGEPGAGDPQVCATSRAGVTHDVQ